MLAEVRGMEDWAMRQFCRIKMDQSMIPYLYTLCYNGISKIILLIPCGQASSAKQRCIDHRLQMQCLTEHLCWLHWYIDKLSAFTFITIGPSMSVVLQHKCTQHWGKDFASRMTFYNAPELGLASDMLGLSLLSINLMIEIALLLDVFLCKPRSYSQLVRVTSLST